MHHSKQLHEAFEVTCRHHRDVSQGPTGQVGAGTLFGDALTLGGRLAPPPGLRRRDSQAGKVGEDSSFDGEPQVEVNAKVQFPPADLASSTSEYSTPPLRNDKCGFAGTCDAAAQCSALKWSHCSQISWD